MSTALRPITLTIAALGGQGGGVASRWLVEVAQREGYLAQATSVPGVAQRTGATIYYLEFFPQAALPADGRRPVMALMPDPGDVDVVVASEIVEAGRMLERGLVTPERTTLIASTHRVYTIEERSSPGDGRVDDLRLRRLAAEQAKRAVFFDMATVAEKQGAVISAVILGAIAGSGVLPFRADAYREAVRAEAVAVEQNLAAFEAGLAQAQAGETPAAVAATAVPRGAPVEARLVPLQERIDREFPARLGNLLMLGVERLVDYQDTRHANTYLDRLACIVRLEPRPEADCRLSEAVARALALWMSFEDTIRVAELKIRPGRTARIRAAVRAKPDEIVRVTEFLKPRVQEICGTLPARLGSLLLASPRWCRFLARVTGDRQIESTAVTGFLLLKSIAGSKRWRRGTLRFQQEESRIAHWLQRIQRLASVDYSLAVEVAGCQRLVKGYGETHERGLARFNAIMQTVDRLCGRPDAQHVLRRLCEAALADEDGRALATALTQMSGGVG